MKKTEIREYSKFEFMISRSSPVIIIKLNLIDSSIQEVSKQIAEITKEDFLDRPGVYFLRLKDGFYIGKAKNLKKRFLQHYSDKEISFITFATHKSELDRMTNQEIMDLESLLLSYASEYGLKIGGLLTNKKNELRKSNHVLFARENQIMAKGIWEKFAQFNISDLLEERNSYEFIESQIPDISIKKFRNSKEDLSFLNSITQKNNVKENLVSKNNPIFEYATYRGIVTKGYNKEKVEMFNREYSIKSLFMYLYENIGNGSIDRNLTKGIRNRGWVTAVTLAYFRIETNGTSRGVLSSLSKETAMKLIEIFVNENY